MRKGKPIITHSNPKLKTWRKTLSDAFNKDQTGITPCGVYTLDVTFFVERPGGHYDSRGNVRSIAPDFPAVKPDLDKLIRAVLDALSDSELIDDDSRICSIHAKKLYTKNLNGIGSTEGEGVKVCLENWP